MDPLRLFSGAHAPKLQHSLKLKSAYAAGAGNPGPGAPEAVRTLRSRLDPEHLEPQFTNFTHDAKLTLDYIIYSAGELTPTALLELPAPSQLGPAPAALPNESWSSDHIALMAEFQHTG